jgi:putative ATP-dependent endonuclease of the OLD family
MRIAKISARHYRTLEDIELSFPTDYCTISGHNNAGKSSVIRLLRELLVQRDSIGIDSGPLDYNIDRTQWVKGTPPIVINYALKLNRSDDLSLINFIQTHTRRNLPEGEIECNIALFVDANNKQTQKLRIGTDALPDAESKEILRKLRSSHSLIIHNSTLNNLDRLFYRGDRFGAAYAIVLSTEEHSQIESAEKVVQNRIKKLTKGHKKELEEMIGKLGDKYSVELSTVDSHSSRKMPFGINLSDKSAEVPLLDWGSGTQNRTRILMSILQAKRVKAGSGEDRTTPTTHSPYMLNQVNPSSNILLRRKKSYNKLPGRHSPEFQRWRQVLAKSESCILLVEGDTDREYIEHLRANYISKFTVPTNLEVVAYNGKNALSNVALLKFVLSKVRRAFITFDLDAAEEVRKHLVTIGLTENKDFAPIGTPKPGRECIEGLLPERILKSVYGRESDLVIQLTGNNKERSEAKRALKRKCLEEFKRHQISVTQSLNRSRS